MKEQNFRRYFSIGVKEDVSDRIENVRARDVKIVDIFLRGLLEIEKELAQKK